MRLRFPMRTPITLAVVFSATILAHVEITAAASSNSLMDISRDGALLACSNRDNGTVTIVDLSSFQKRWEVPVGLWPEGTTFLGGTHIVAIAVYGEDRIVFVDADRGEKIGQIPVFDEPYGIVSDVDGGCLYATLDYPGCIVEVDAKTREVKREFPVGSFFRGIALSPDRTRLLVTEYFTAIVKAVEISTGKVVDQWQGPSTDNLARQLVLHPRRPKAYVPHIRSRVIAFQAESSIFPFVSVVDTGPSDDRRRKSIPMDAFRGNLVTANPWEAAISADGQKLYVVFGGTNDLFACQVIDDDYRELADGGYLRVGRNPRAVRVSPDGKVVYVYNGLDFNVVAYDAQSLRPLGTVTVCDNPLGEKIWRGKSFFFSALPPMVGRRWISCASCHPDGDADGRTWQKPEGLRNTPTFFGMAWTHPLLWSASRNEVQDWELAIRGPLMGGRGLMSGEPEPVLGPPNQGRSADLDALAAYANSLRFTISPHAAGGLSVAAQRGRDLFFSTGTGCGRCHPAPFYTDSIPRPPDQIVRHNVGTGGDDPSENAGPVYDTPTLLGIYRTAPYLHHGKAQTLHDVLTVYNRKDKHGTTSHLTEQQISDLVEFLQYLPYEDPEPLARRAGLTRTDN